MPNLMDAIAEALADASATSDEPCNCPKCRAKRAAAAVLPEAKMARLREVAESYRRGSDRFAVGDIVTPRADGPVRGAGEPMIILELDDHAYIRLPPPRVESSWDHGYGRRLDMRVLLFAPTGDMVAHWAESWAFIPYEPPAADLADDGAETAEG